MDGPGVERVRLHYGVSEGGSPSVLGESAPRGRLGQLPSGPSSTLNARFAATRKFLWIARKSRGPWRAGPRYFAPKQLRRPHREC
jgi:hypothetical protein